jgi:hypothetical protein
VRDAAVATEVAAHEASGKLERVVRNPMPAALNEALGGMHNIHNAVVAITGPRQD